MIKLALLAALLIAAWTVPPALVDNLMRRLVDHLHKPRAPP